MKMNFFKLALVLLLSFTVNAQQKIYQSAFKSHSLRCSGLEKINSDTKLSEVNKDWVVNKSKISIIAIPNENQSKKLLNELLGVGLSNYSVRKNGIISGYLEVSDIEKLDNCNYLRSVIPTTLGKTSLGLTNNQASQAFFSDHISERLGLTGKGVKIGIISDSYNQNGGAPDGIINGDLPGEDNPNGFNKEVVILSDDFSRGVDEGRAMAELIHDIAPDAELFFHSGFNGLFNLADAVLNLADAGCNIIVDDVFNAQSPVYQDGIVAQAINDVASQGISYFTAAANHSNKGFETQYDFELIEDGDRTIERFKYQSGKTERSVKLTFASLFRVDLAWDDFSIFGSFDDVNFPETDLDIFLIDSETGKILAKSETTNGDTGLPFETLTYQSFSRETIIANIVIENREGSPSPERIYYRYDSNEIFSAIGELESVLEPTNGTIFGYRAAKGAITLGAMDYRLSPEFGGTPLVENFSSYGGIPVILDLEGNIKPLEIRNKPDLVAPDNVNTSFFGAFDSDGDGFLNFFGTSAAAPNAAALAALMLEVNSELSNEDIRKILIDSALDMDDELTEEFDEGFDFASGHGLIQGDKAIALATGEAMVYRVEMIDAKTKELINIIEEDEELDLTDVEDNVDLRLAATNVSSLNSVLRGGADNRLISNSSEATPFLAVNSEETFTRNWEATSGNYNLNWFAFGEGTSKEFSNINFSVVNSNFDNLRASVFNLGAPKFTAFPNPVLSQEKVKLNLPAGIIESYEVFDQSGNLVASGIGSIVNTTSLTQGIYIVIATDSNGGTHETKISIS